MESDARFYRRRVNEELAAANRAVTEAARDRRIVLAGLFQQRLNASQARGSESGFEMASSAAATGDQSMFGWR